MDRYDILYRKYLRKNLHPSVAAIEAGKAYRLEDIRARPRENYRMGNDNSDRQTDNVRNIRPDEGSDAS